MLLRLGDDGVDVFLVVEREHPAEGVGAQVFDEGLGYGVTVGEEQLFESAGVFEGAAVGEFARRVDLRVGAEAGRDFLDVAPLADGVVVVPDEAQGVDLGVAGGAVRVLGVRLKLIAQGQLGALRRRGLDRRHVSGRGRGSLAEDRLAEPDAAVDRAMAGAVGGQAEDRAHRQQAAAMIAGLERDALEAGRLRLGQAVELAEAGVGHGPIGVDEGVDGQVLGEQFTEELHRLGLQAGLQPVLVGRIEFLVGWEHADAVQLQPLAGEVVDETTGFSVREHALHFFPQAVAAESAFFGRSEETVVGHGAPEEIGEA